MKTKERSILPPKEWLSVSDLSEYLGLSKSTIYKKLHKKLLPFYKPSNGMVWFRLSEINAWVESGRVSDLQMLSNSLTLFKTNL